MVRDLEYPISSRQEGLTIEAFLRGLGYSHHVLTHLKRTEGGICRNGTWTFTNQKLAAGDLLQIHIVEMESSCQIPAVYVPLDIVYEDADLLVINKPADLPVQPSMNHHEHTLANGLCYYYKEKGISFTYRCINRLDRDTSGLLIIARHMLSAALLSDQLLRREIHREYFALVEGELPLQGTITSPIARAKDSVIRREVNIAEGEPAITHYERLLCRQGFSAARVVLGTGRTHQIRVHMASIGHPLLGDFLYNPAYAQSREQDAVSYPYPIHRQALHSHRLSFPHPITRQQMEFTAPLPEDMSLFLGRESKVDSY